jgi:hypothetical protein
LAVRERPLLEKERLRQLGEDERRRERKKKKRERKEKERKKLIFYSKKLLQ